MKHLKTYKELKEGTRSVNPIELFIEELKQRGLNDEEIEREVRKFKITAPDETASHNGFMW